MCEPWARLMTQDGGRLLFIGAVQDVTESKVVEEALKPRTLTSLPTCPSLT